MPRRTPGHWLSAGELEQATKGGLYALHSQRVQALCQTLAATVATATELRQQEAAETGTVQTPYPQHSTPEQTAVWKDPALQLLPSGHLRLPTHRRPQQPRCSCRGLRSTTRPTCGGWS